jgi:hypothetical protein
MKGRDLIHHFNPETIEAVKLKGDRHITRAKLVQEFSRFAHQINDMLPPGTQQFFCMQELLEARSCALRALQE